MRLAIVVVIAGLALPALAEDRSSAPGGGEGKAAGRSGAAKGPAKGAAASGAAQDLARALVSPEDWERVLDHYATGLAGQITQSLTARGDAVPDGLQGTIRKELGDELPYAQVLEKQAAALAGRFSPDELKRAATFYGSPLGKKIVQALPEAQSELGHELQGRLASAVPQIVKRVAPRALSAPGDGAPSAPGAGKPRDEGTGSGAEPDDDADGDAPAGRGPDGAGKPPSAKTPTTKTR